MAERQDYDQKSEKTNNGELAAAYMCSPETAAEEFEISGSFYYQVTGRSWNGTGNRGPTADARITCVGKASFLRSGSAYVISHTKQAVSLR